MALTCRLPFLVDFSHDIEPEFSRSNILHAIFISGKNGPIVTNWKANILIENLASNVTMKFDLGYDLDLEMFKVKYLICFISEKKIVQLPWNEKQTYQ